MFFAASLLDLLSSNNIIRTVYINHIGFVAFIFSQAYVLSMRFNRALAISEQLTLHLEAVVADRTQALEASNRQLLRLNVTDGLTGLFNRRHFDETMAKKWQHAISEHHDLAVMMLDIDYFKLYNDHYGHQAGDECLKAVAQAIAGCIPQPQHLVARYGGEEFVVVLVAHSGDAALAVANAICHHLEQTALPHIKSPLERVSVSIGVASIAPQPKDSSQQLVKMADDALYHAKRQGRNRAVLAPGL
jgi:two-component system, sensor histidine kinase LadS